MDDFLEGPVVLCLQGVTQTVAQAVRIGSPGQRQPALPPFGAKLLARPSPVVQRRSKLPADGTFQDLVGCLLGVKTIYVQLVLLECLGIGRITGLPIKVLILHGRHLERGLFQPLGHLEILAQPARLAQKVLAAA